MASSWPRLKHTTLIGFGHRARQGKDEAAKALIALAPLCVRKFGFADALRAVCRVSYGMTDKDPQLLQAVGVDWRANDPDVWVRACLWAIAEWDADATGPQVACVSDVRFHNEAEAIRAASGHLVRIRRWRGDGEPYQAADRDPLHISETALDAYPWPHTISNYDGNIRDLNEFRQSVQQLGRQLAPAVFGAVEEQPSEVTR